MKLTINRSRQIFKEYLTETGHKSNTIVTKLALIKTFYTYIKDKTSIRDLRDITKADIKLFLVDIENIVSDRTKKKYSKQYKKGLFLTVQLLFKSLYIKDEILSNPSDNIDYNPSGEIKDKVIFSELEIGEVLDSIIGDDFISKRDRTLFELMYSSGLRPGEVTNIKVSDINFKESLLLVRLGKFGKDRIVPVSETAMLFLKKFTHKMNRDNYIFTSSFNSNKLGISAVNRRLTKYIEASSIEKKGITSHSIRHSVATHLLNRGAGLRYVQALLGHESVETTVVYTHLLGDKLKRIYKSHHPRENGYYEEIDLKYLKAVSKLEVDINKLDGTP